MLTFCSIKRILAVIFCIFHTQILEVVGKGDSTDILLDLAVDPVLQTADVDKLAATFTGTGINYRVLLCGLLTQAYLTLALQFFLRYRIYVLV